jgi:hypothetical protein
LLKLTNHLDKLESTYDLILKEYESRVKKWTYQEIMNIK